MRKYYKMIKESISQENTTIFNVYVSNNRVQSQEEEKTKKKKQQECTTTTESLTCLYQKWNDPAGKKSIKIQLNLTALSINWI